MDRKFLKKITKRSSKIGLDPGTLVYIGDKESGTSIVHVILYTKEFIKQDVCSVEKEISDLKNNSENKDVFQWIHITGLHDISKFQEIGQIFAIDNLILEDILNTDQRPKVEELENGLFITLKYIYLNQATKLITEQFSMILVGNTLLTFSEHIPDFFTLIQEKLNNKSSKLRQNKIDFLAYTLLDSIVDQYFLHIENITSTIENLEEKVIHQPDSTTLPKIQSLKKDIMNFKRFSYPLKEAITFLEKSKSPFFQKGTARYIRDLSDHIHYITESLDNMKDSVNLIMDLYLSTLNKKTNEVIKVLTLLSSIFIPLTFIVGVYGMNFEYFPELTWRNGYFIIWGIMISVAIFMLFLFKKKKWL